MAFRKNPFKQLFKVSWIYALLYLLIFLACFYYYVKHSESFKNDLENKKNLKTSQLGKQQLNELIDYSKEDNNFFQEAESQVILENRIVHLDLKGAPPKISYFEKLFPLLKTFGATGVLIEYEDMFPYTGDVLGNVSALNTYDLDDIQAINMLAKETNLKVIPLIQTFGHLEFLLKLKEFKEYREIESNPQVICPSNDKTLMILENMIDQIVLAHPDIEMLHIGCDETLYLGYCQKCTARMSLENISKNGLYLKHIKSVAQIIKRKYSKLRVLIWDDMLRNMPLKELHEIKLGDNLEPVVWRYTKNVFDDLGPKLWNKYSKVFKNVWIASAFKGASGSDAYLPDTHTYMLNHKSWLSVIAEYKQKVNFLGIFITGWQRYDHFSVLCELLPVGMPALAMSLRLLRGFQDSPMDPPKEVANLLQCNQPFGLIGPAFGSPKCKFPGGDILENILLFSQLKEEFDRFKLDTRVKGWMNDYNIHHNFSSPHYIELVAGILDKIKAELEEVKMDLISAMDEVYDQYTIDEWLETHILPFENEVNKMLAAREALLTPESWPRRPLKYQQTEL